jgi:transposase
MNEEVKVKRTRRRYDEAFRREAVALVESTGRPLNEIATQLGITHWNLRDWIPLYGKRSTAGQLEARVHHLEQENASLRQQRDALKKAMGILAEPSGNASRS